MTCQSRSFETPWGAILADNRDTLEVEHVAIVIQTSIIKFFDLKPLQ